MATLAAVLVSVSGCSPRMIAADALGAMLATGDSVFTEDDDIELIGDALPFSLKLVESLLAESPNHRGLLLAAARGYVLYSYAYVDFAAEQAATQDIRHARLLRLRARKFYMRGFDYAVRGLEINHPGIGEALFDTPEGALSQLDGDAMDHVPFLYWAANALGLAISVSRNDPAMLARLPEVEAMLQRLLALDEAYDNGALHEFALVWTGVAVSAPDRNAIDRHYQRALELSAGQRASLYVAYAMVTALPDQERQQFHSLMQKALAVDTDALPGTRLLNAIAQRRARWLLSRSDELFLE